MTPPRWLLCGWALSVTPPRLSGITSDDSKQWGFPFWSGYRAAPNTASIGCGFLAVVSLPTSDVSSTVPLALIAITTLAACASLGGGLYEFLVVDPAWPKRPGIIQPRNGGVSRARFWIPRTRRLRGAADRHAGGGLG